MNQEEAVDYFDRVIARTTADKAARIIISGIKKRKRRILVGPDAHVYALLERLFPNMWQSLMAKLKRPRSVLSIRSDGWTRVLMTSDEDHFPCSHFQFLITICLHSLLSIMNDQQLDNEGPLK